jgi:D-glutamate cyclase
MTPQQKLSAIIKAIHIDPGQRGLARDPHDNLFLATAGDFEKACESLLTAKDVAIVTGFYIPSSDPPAFETDGPHGAYFLERSLRSMGINAEIRAEYPVLFAIEKAAKLLNDLREPLHHSPSHVVFIERGGPASDGKRYTMRGREITEFLDPANDHVENAKTIGIGDGGNEMGMGKIAHETIVKNINNGDQIHCKFQTDQLIVAGVSNWGGYALSAGLFVLKNQMPTGNLFDFEIEKKILEIMVETGPLVDGVIGTAQPTVDGLNWEDYTRPLRMIRDILWS